MRITLSLYDSATERLILMLPLSDVQSEHILTLLFPNGVPDDPFTLPVFPKLQVWAETQPPDMESVA